MKHAEAEKLLGGYATGTLTEAERRTLFEAALERQDLFDALVDEEALRELLADPAARAHLLSALAPVAPKIVPFYRRPGIIGAAASLIVAATAGLAYLRSPEALPLAAQQEAAKAPAATTAAKVAEKTIEAPAQAQSSVVSARKVASAAAPKESAPPSRTAETPVPAVAPPPPAPLMVAASAPAPISEDAARAQRQAEPRRGEAREERAKKAERPRPAPMALVEVVGQMSGPPAVAKAKAPDRTELNAAVASLSPSWTLEPQPDGTTRVTVTASRGAEVLLLRRGASGVEVLKLQAIQDRLSAPVQWRGQVHLVAGDVLDLYLMNGPVADPAKLPETGPVEGFRARIHPVEGKDAPR